MREVATKLWIGNAFEARDLRAILNDGIEAVVDLAIEEAPISGTRELICCRIPISDGGGNPPSRLQLAVKTIAKLVTLKVPTLVACSAGMSRSPAIVAATLSWLNGVSLAEALEQVTRTGPCDVSPALLADIAAGACD